MRWRARADVHVGSFPGRLRRRGCRTVTDRIGLSAARRGIQPARIRTMQRHSPAAWSFARPQGIIMLLSVLASCPLAQAPAAAARAPGPMDAATRDSLIALIQKDRADTERWLKSDPTSYLAAVRRLDFDDRARLSVGSAAGNDLRLE